MATMPTAEPLPLPLARLRPPPPRPAMPIVSLILIFACGAAFAASWLFGNGLDEATLIACGAKDRSLILRSHQWWRLVSAGFLHADLMHLVVNLYALFTLGRVVEGLWGHRRFLIIYATALVGGSAASLAATRGTSVGASGAAFGLLGALVAFLVLHRRVIAPRARTALLINLAVVLAINIVLGILLPFIDNAAHLGGLAAGAAAAMMLRPVRARGSGGPFSDVLASVAAAAAALAMLGSLGMAARHARASEWRLLIGGEMTTHSLRRGEFTVSVPKGWRYRPPSGLDGQHVFDRPGLATVAIRLLPRAGALDTAAAASKVQRELAQDGAVLIATRDLPMGDQMGAEMHFRRNAHNEVQRHRVAVFPARDGRIVCATFACLEERYKALEVLFDRILYSIQVGTPGRAATPDERVWEKVAEDPNNPDAAVALAARYAHEGRYEPAERLLLATLRRHPSHAETHNQLGLLYATARPPFRRPAEAVRHALKATALKLGAPSYLATLALAHEAAGDREQALAAARRAAELAPDDATYADLVKRLSR